MNTNKQRGGARVGSGRKPQQPGVVMVPVTLKMSEAQKNKLRKLGGAPWVRDRIDKAQEPHELVPDPAKK